MQHLRSRLPPHKAVAADWLGKERSTVVDTLRNNFLHPHLATDSLRSSKAFEKVFGVETPAEIADEVGKRPVGKLLAQQTERKNPTSEAKRRISVNDGTCATALADTLMDSP